MQKNYLLLHYRRVCIHVPQYLPHLSFFDHEVSRATYIVQKKCFKYRVVYLKVNIKTYYAITFMTKLWAKSFKSIFLSDVVWIVGIKIIQDIFYVIWKSKQTYETNWFMWQLTSESNSYESRRKSSYLLHKRWVNNVPNKRAIKGDRTSSVKCGRGCQLSTNRESLCFQDGGHVSITIPIIPSFCSVT